MESSFEADVVLFDMDGVLANTEEPLIQAWKDAINSRRLALDVETLRPLLRGVLDYSGVKDVLAQHVAKNAVSAMVDSTMDNYRATLPTLVEPVPGALELLQELATRRVPMAVVTSAPRSTMQTVIGALGMSRFFAQSFSSDDVARRKPDPEVLELAASRLGTPHSRCLVIEDSPEGILAARRLGMICVGLSTTYPVESLSDAHIIVRTLREFPWQAVSLPDRRASTGHLEGDSAGGEE